MALSRNSPCDCGSGLKYRNCCGKLSDNTAIKPISPELTEIKIIDGVKITVPDSLDLITPYVLREQESWFEIEISFVRKLLRSGDHVIDIGANYGLYTIPMSKLIGEYGKLFSFEPASSTSGCLQQSIELNEINNITLITKALSNKQGKAKLSIYSNSELNSLESDPGSNFEEVELNTLDNEYNVYNWENIEFFKLDAEGEESNILRGGSRFFQDLSPLVMFELKHGTKVNLSLISQFQDMSYQIYRLLPALDILIPFGEHEEPDGYLLNLFCCKNDKKQELIERGLLLGVGCQQLEQKTEKVIEKKYSEPNWQKIVKQLPFAKVLGGEQSDWKINFDTQLDKKYYSALELFIFSRNDSYVLSDRNVALMSAYKILSDVYNETDCLLHICLLARVAGGLGYRSQECRLIGEILNKLQAGMVPQFKKLFLPVCARYEQLRPSEYIDKWFISSLVEQLERQRAFSSYYTGKKSLQNLELLKTLGYQSADMERRRQLVRMRYKLQSSPLCSELLKEEGENNCNVEYWCGQK